MSENNNERMDNLQNQIVLMLKGVGVIEENELELKENINDIKENLFGDDDFSYELIKCYLIMLLIKALEEKKNF